MVIGSLTQTMNESMENYIDSIYLEPDDMVCILGETALHHTLEEHDDSYLWEFACLNEGETYTKNNDGTGTFESTRTNTDGSSTTYHADIDKNGNKSWTKKTTKPIDRKTFDKEREENNNELRKKIDAYHNVLDKNKDEESFNTNKSTLINNLDNEIKRLGNTSYSDENLNSEHNSTINRLKSFKERIEKEEFPKSWLAKKIAWFRSLYAKFMHKNTAARQSGIGGTFKWILASIAKIIDTLLRKLQNTVN